MSETLEGDASFSSIQGLKEAIADRYDVVRELGAGGMAVVYLATDVRYNRPVALKVLRPELASSLGPDRFIREISIASRLNHPHIVPLFDSGVAAGRLYYVMPYLQGETLRERIEREESLDVALALRLTMEVCGALDYAHRQGIVHRDIKPENILLSEGHALVADFGLAHAIDYSAASRLTGAGFAIGTPAYMSPEQAAADIDIGAGSDQYSLACVLFELLTGKTPFRGPTTMAFIGQHLTEHAPSAMSFRADVPDAVDQALRRALSKDASDRFATTADLAKALDGVAAVAPSAVSTESIVVFDFLNISGSPDVQWLSSGIAETIGIDLKRIESVRVVRGERLARALATRSNPVLSEDDAMQVARSLGVRWLVWGGYQAHDDGIRITPRLGDARSGVIVSSSKLDGAMRDLFALQDRIVVDVVAWLELSVSEQVRARMAKPETTSLTAYELFARARQLQRTFTVPAIVESRQFLRLAIERDPEYALAHSGLGYSYAFGYIATSDPDDLARALTHLERATSLDPDLGEAYIWLCYALQRASRLEEALAAGERATTLEPESAGAFYFFATLHWGLSTLGADRWPMRERALRAVFMSAQLEPGWQPTYHMMADLYLSNGQYDEARTPIKKALALESGVGQTGSPFIGALFLDGQLALRTGDLDRARSQFGLAVELYEKSNQMYAHFHVAVSQLGLGELDFRSGAFDDALISAHRVSELCRVHPRKVGIGFTMVRARLLSAKASFALGVGTEAKREVQEAERMLTAPTDFPLVPLYEANHGVAAVAFASTFAVAGKRDMVMEWLERAWQASWNDHPSLAMDPAFDRMRTDPDFLAFIERCITRGTHPAPGSHCTGVST